MTKTCPGLTIASHLIMCVCASAWAGDWPTHLQNNHRSAYTVEALKPPLAQQWRIAADQSARPAWSEYPAPQDLWQNLYDNKPRLTSDRAFHVVVGEGRLYYGSSSNDKVVCRSIEDGRVLWTHITGGPIRFAPTLYQDRVYIGSDDGTLYCLNARTGQEVWTHQPEFACEKMMIYNRLCSVCPVRTSVLIDQGIAYWAAGVFSEEQTGLQRYLMACRARDGHVLWTVTPPKPLHGYPLATRDQLFMPAGKSTPLAFNKSNGALIGDFNTQTRQGGSYAILSHDNKLLFGPHYSESGSYLEQYDAGTRTEEGLGWGPGNHLVVTPSACFYASDTALSKFDWIQKKRLWSVPSLYPDALILAGDLLFAGGDSQVAARDTVTGSEIWKASVSGRVQDLAVANHCLFVSTSQGHIYCFQSSEK
ncbi:MAG: PQQ-binding-like beta-propeller repeat protein [Phycisphaerae bacterium]|nr:PQQ-binding-like beta-propeller repeat protein [Phycisphaerae bacterium]